MPNLNLAHWDRGLRIGVGLLLLYVGFFASPSGLLAAACRIFLWLPLLTGIVGWCPVYAFFGWSTKSKMRHE
ncbi:MAG: DUF2892 domain-containing protein [Acidobacteriota bacterium]